MSDALTRSEQERAFLLKEAMREVLNDPKRHDELKDIIKQALKEWLDGHWATFGKWTFRGVAGAALVGLLYLYGRAKGLL